MNETFDIKRLGKLLRYEVVNYIPNFFKSIIIFASVIAAVWILSLVMDIDFMSAGRQGLVAMLFTLAVALSPFIIYKDMNNRKKGYLYAMIPASTLEKLVSMVLLCMVVVPVLSYAVLAGTDLLLWLLTKTGIGSFYGIAFFNPFSEDVVRFADLENPYQVLDGILYYVNIVAYTIMFNAIFRKNKVLKTILFNISMSFAFVILVAAVANMTTPEFWENLFTPFIEWADGKTDVEMFSYMMIVVRCLCLLFSSLFLVISYFRIKKVNY